MSIKVQYCSNKQYKLNETIKRGFNLGTINLWETQDKRSRTRIINKL